MLQLFLGLCIHSLLITFRLYPSALTSPVLPEALLPLPEAVAVDAVAAVLASAVLLVVALAVHLHLPLAVAGKSNIIHFTMNRR